MNEIAAADLMNGPVVASRDRYLVSIIGASSSWSRSPGSGDGPARHPVASLEELAGLLDA